MAPLAEAIFLQCLATRKGVRTAFPEEKRAALLREVRILACLKHPPIVRVRVVTVKGGITYDLSRTHLLPFRV
jgi:hypothetical protein